MSLFLLILPLNFIIPAGVVALVGVGLYNISDTSKNIDREEIERIRQNLRK